MGVRQQRDVPWPALAAWVSFPGRCEEGAAVGGTHARGWALPLRDQGEHAAQHSDIFRSCSLSTETLGKVLEAKVRDEL